MSNNGLVEIFSDGLPITDSRSNTCFSTCSAGHPCTCLMRFSLKCAASVGVKEHVALPGAEPAGTEPGGIAPLTTPGP